MGKDGNAGSSNLDALFYRVVKTSDCIAKVILLKALCSVLQFLLLVHFIHMYLVVHLKSNPCNKPKL